MIGDEPDETPAETATDDFFKQIDITDEDITTATQQVNTKPRKKAKYVLSEARIKQMDDMRAKGHAMRREKKAIKDAILNEKLKEYRAQAEQKMKDDILKTATRIMKQDRAIQNAVRKVFSDVDYNPVVYNELIKIVGKIQEKNPQQPTNHYSFS
jgi:tryptophan 2,3-dioxygenase